MRDFASNSTSPIVDDTCNTIFFSELPRFRPSDGTNNTLFSSELPRFRSSDGTCNTLFWSERPGFTSPPSLVISLGKNPRYNERSDEQKPTCRHLNSYETTPYFPPFFGFFNSPVEHEPGLPFIPLAPLVPVRQTRQQLIWASRLPERWTVRMQLIANCKASIEAPYRRLTDEWSLPEGSNL